MYFYVCNMMYMVNTIFKKSINSKELMLFEVSVKFKKYNHQYNTH